MPTTCTTTALEKSITYRPINIYMYMYNVYKEAIYVYLIFVVTLRGCHIKIKLDWMRKITDKRQVRDWSFVTSVAYVYMHVYTWITYQLQACIGRACSPYIWCDCEWCARALGLQQHCVGRGRLLCAVPLPLSCRGQHWGRTKWGINIFQLWLHALNWWCT